MAATDVTGRASVPLAVLERFGALKRLPGFGGGSVASRLFVEIGSLAIEDPADIEPVLDWLLMAGASAAVLGAPPAAFVELVGDARWREMCRKACGHALAAAPPPVRQRVEDVFDARWSRFFRRRPAIPPVTRSQLRRLARLPRGGYSSPAAGKCITLPRETQGDHSLVTAILAVVVARTDGVPAAEPALMALFHHLPAVVLPIIDHEGAAVLGDSAVAALQRDALRLILRDFPENGRAVLGGIFARYAQGADERDPFLVADVLDRALEVRRHSDTASLTLGRAVRDYQLLNDGPLGSIERAILARYGLFEGDPAATEVR